MTTADFESIVRSHQSMVYSIAYNFFHNVAVAEEVAQDVFLQLYQHRTEVRSDAHLVFWLRKATTHRCIDTSRRRSFANEVQLEELPDVAAAAPVHDPLLHERLRRLVASLPEKLRLVVILRYTEDMDPNEIGEALDMPVRTVWSHLQRGIALMRGACSRMRVRLIRPSGPARGLSRQSAHNRLALDGGGCRCCCGRYRGLVHVSRTSAHNTDGIFILSTEAKEISAVNIVGRVDPNDLRKLGGQFGIPQIGDVNKKD